MKGVGYQLIKVIEQAAVNTGPPMCGCRPVCYGGLSIIARHFAYFQRTSALSY